MGRIACIDVGNTSTHCAIVEGDCVVEAVSIPTCGLFAEVVEWLDLHDYAGISYCCVVPVFDLQLATLLTGRASKCHRLSYERLGGLCINYPHPEEIGEDRLADVVAAQHLGLSPSIILNVGTALKVEIMPKCDEYIGGMIAPGLSMLTDGLSGKTAKLPRIPADEIFEDVQIGVSTIDSIKLGCRVGFTGMVRALCERAEEEMEKRGVPRFQKIVTGGGSAAVKSCLVGWTFVPQLSGLGLAASWRMQFGEG